jgi:hypothetical protein
MTRMDEPQTRDGTPSTPAAIICGIERGGTTLLLDMLKAHPRVYARFEVGLLLAESLSFKHIMACQPYTKMLVGVHSLHVEDLRPVAEAPNWVTAYDRLLRLCLGKERNPVDRRRNFFIDKTPAYSAHIDRVMSRVPGVPVVGLIRDPRAVYASMKKRALIRAGKVPKSMVRFFAKRFIRYMTPLVAAGESHSEVLLVRYEDLVTAPDTWLPVVCRHFGLDFLPRMLDPSNAFARPTNSYSRLDPRKIAEFADIIEPKEEQEIIDRIGRLRWTLYPVAQRLRHLDLTSLGDPLPNITPIDAARMKHLYRRDRAA